MKKIFAIALAVVMVLSMASAFALSQCATWGTNWDCVADDLWCGKGKVEVVPYVKVNTACGVEYQVSDCAAAIMTEDVFFAIKLTVDAYPDPAWWAEAYVDFEANGLDLPWAYDDNRNMNRDLATKIDMDATEEKVYYMAVEDWAWLDSSDKDFDLDAVVFEVPVLEEKYCDADGFGVCAELNSYYDGFSFFAYNVAGDYEYRLANASSATKNIVAYKALSTDGMDDTLTIFTRKADGSVKNSVVFTIVDGSITKAEWTDDDFYNAVMADFGFTACGTAACLYEKNFFNNFGWNDAQEDCFDWSEKGASVVDTDCVVAIPKTGDASVLAWLF